MSILVASHGDSNFDAFAKHFFESIGVHDFQERYSDNYFGGYYYLGKTNSLEYVVFLLEDIDDDNMTYGVMVTDLSTAENFEKSLEYIIQGKIIPAKIRIARVENFGTKSEKRIFY